MLRRMRWGRTGHNRSRAQTMKCNSAYSDDRLARLGRFLLICGTAFALFGIYYLVLGHHATAMVCGIEALFIVRPRRGG